jgi:hypothetical protein
MSDVLGLKMAVQVTNSTSVPAEVIPANMRLNVDGDSTAPSSNETAVQIPPGSSKSISVEFHRYGDARCSEPMTLSLEHAVQLGSRDLPMRPVSFVPSNSDT